MVLFGRKIARKQLEEYATSFPMVVRWVESFTFEHCEAFLTNETDVYFLQFGCFCPKLIAHMRDLGIEIHFINTEQMSRLESVKSNDQNQVSFPFEGAVFAFFHQHYCNSFVDYSLANIQLARRHLPKNTRFTLHCFYPTTNLSSSLLASNPKPFDSIFVGDAKSQHRKTTLACLPNTTIVQTMYGIGKDKLLNQHKILINLHFGPSYAIFEELRCIPALLNKIIVVSEISILDTAHPIYPFIVFVPIEEIPAKVADILANYDTYYNQLFSNREFNELEQHIKEYCSKVNKYQV